MHEIMRQSTEFDFVYRDAIAQRFDFAHRTYAMKLWQRKSRNDYLGEMDRIEEVIIMRKYSLCTARVHFEWTGIPIDITISSTKGEPKQKEIRAIDRLKSEPSPLNWIRCWWLTEISVNFKLQHHLLVAVASMASKVSHCDHSFNPLLDHL